MGNFKEEVSLAENFLLQHIGYKTAIFRFPGGSRHRDAKFKYAINEMGYLYFDWNVSAADTAYYLEELGTEQDIENHLANNVIKGAKDKKRAVILMHDKYYTVRALPKMIEGLTEQGFEFDVLINY